MERRCFRHELVALVGECFLFGSSASDELPLSLARKAKASGRPVVYMLDNWSAYARCLSINGHGLFIPDGG